MMFQSSALYPHRTVGENMAFSLRMRKADTATTGKHVNKAATILNLDLRLDRYPHDIAAKVIVVEFTGAETGRAYGSTAPRQETRPPSPARMTAPTRHPTSRCT